MGTLRERVFDLSHYGDRAVLVEGARVLDARQLGAEIEAVAAGLAARGVGVGDRVAWLGPTATGTVVGVLAIGRLGAIAVPLSPRHTPNELAHVLGDSGAALVVAHPSMAERLPEGTAVVLADDVRADGSPTVVELDDEAPALLIYTSGTTGRSKGAALPWRAVVSNMTALGRAWGLGPADRCSLMLPLFHVHGLCIGVFAMLLSGVTIQIHGKFDAAALVDDVRGGTTVWLAVPTMYALLLEHVEQHPSDGEVLARARLFTSGSAPLPARHFAEFERRTGHRILERYGMTETLITLSNPLAGPRLPGHVGMPVDGVARRIVDDDGRDVAPGQPGELWVRGTSMMLGYWRNPGATAAACTDGWFRTGDVAIVGDGGSIRIVGRTSTDILKCGGFKVSALEIEDALREHPDIVDVAVVGVEDPRWGERIAAVVVLRSAAPLVDLAPALENHCRERLADYKQPRVWLALDALPRNAMGKLEKPRLRTLLAGLPVEAVHDHRSRDDATPADRSS